MFTIGCTVEGPSVSFIEILQVGEDSRETHDDAVK